jgi:hypothetical protein
MWRVLLVAAEAIVPINSEGGRTIGMRAHLFLFLDACAKSWRASSLRECSQ